MPVRYNQSESYNSLVPTRPQPLNNGVSEWTRMPPPPPPITEPEGIKWGRYLEVLKRHWFMIIAIIVTGTVLGYFASKRVKPVYQAQATLWISATSAQPTGPIRVPQFLPNASWLELLQSFAIVEPVVRRLHLNAGPKNPSDSVLFRDFESGPNLHPGAYVLNVDSTGTNYRLSTIKGVLVERGRVGDSVGRSLGFKWLPNPQFLKPRKSMTFGVTTVRGAAVALRAKMHASLQEASQILRMTLEGSESNRTAATVNAWADEMVRTAGVLKASHLLEFKKTLEDQLSLSATALHTAESQLEQFRVQTITMPSGRSTTTAAVAAPDPVVAGFFQQKAQLDEVRGERQALENILAQANGGPINPQAFLQLPGILVSNPQLRSALDELSSRQAALRTEQQFLTDQNPRIQQLSETVRVLEQQTIPRIARDILTALRAREPELDGRIAEQSRELRDIPVRSTEETRLVRQVVTTENLYNALKARYEEVSMAEAQSAPDLSILDVASPPQFPDSNDASRIRLLAIVASIGFALGLALLLDRLDKRVMYPEHATDELGLLIAGTVPKFKPRQSTSSRFQTMTAAVESFRTLRLAVRYDFPGDVPVVVAITSPSPGDGKSLVSSNLALAFASSGSRTLLIDGDVRRGTLHTTFEVPVAPGLVDYLDSHVGIDAILRATTAENLFVIPRGSRKKRAPELLVSDLMNTLIGAMRREFDVVIVDCPPLIAGIDAYALGAAAGSMLIVLRPGVTDRKLAAAKLTVVDRLPIRLLGTVLNGVPTGGSYRYYGHDYNYGAAGAEPMADVATPGGLVLGALHSAGEKR